MVSDIELHWAAVPFPRETDSDLDLNASSYSSGKPVQIPAELVERLGIEYLVLFTRMSYWHQRGEGYDWRRVAEVMCWGNDTERLVPWIAGLQQMGLVTTTDRLRRRMEEMYPEYYEREAEREARNERLRVERDERQTQRAERGWMRQAGLAADARRAIEIECHTPNEPDGSYSGAWPLIATTARPPRDLAVVYVLRNLRGRAVYVGSTDNFGARLKAHQASGKTWATWTALPCADRQEAYEVEEQYLAEYMPHLNVPGPQRRSGGQK